MKLVAASLVLGQVLGYQIVNDARQQIEFLRVRRKNSGFFEEAKDDNFKRECVEEMCSYEELLEIKDDPAEADKTWKMLTKQCYEKQCSAQGTKLCVQTWNARVCHCKNGWTTTDEKDDCSVDIDECAGEVSPCSGEEVCINTDGSYTCDCASGYRSSGDGNCENINECDEGHQCGPNSDCKDLIGSVTCECHSGYSSNEETGICEDDDECADDSICSANSQCVNNPGSYVCECNDGYENKDGVCADIDECSSGDVDCGKGTCTNNDGSYVCFCPIGYKNDGDPITGACVDENECENESSCLPTQSCHNTQGAFKCCDEGQDFDENTGECINKDPCEGIECEENSSCQAGVCSCNLGYHRLEQTDTDFIPLQALSEDGSGVIASAPQLSASPCVTFCHNNPCGDGSDCVNGDNDFTCIDKCNSENISCIGGTCTKGVCTCDSGSVNVGGVCIATTTESGGPRRLGAEGLTMTTTVAQVLCDPGFSHDGVECVDTDECQINNGQCDSMCMNYYGTHRCYENMHEEEAMCHHTSVKSSSIAGYECVCFKNYHLCNDGFSCVTNNGYNKYNRRGQFDYEGATSCPSGQFGIDGKCFSVSSDKKTHSDASEACENQGGSLVNLQSRKVWWVVGNKVEYGEASFWVSSNSDAGMFVHGDNTGALLANPAGNMDNVPPQLNAVSGSELHAFACQF